MTGRDPGRARAVFVRPPKPVDDMSDEDWQQMGRDLFDAVQQRRADTPDDGAPYDEGEP